MIPKHNCCHYHLFNVELIYYYYRPKEHYRSMSIYITIHYSSTQTIYIYNQITEQKDCSNDKEDDEEDDIEIG